MIYPFAIRLLSVWYPSAILLRSHPSAILFANRVFTSCFYVYFRSSECEKNTQNFM